jgi:hypothetical protein
MTVAGYEIVTNSQSVELLAANDYRGWAQVDCPDGKVILGGGFYVNQSGSVAVVSSRPDATGETWSVAVDDVTPQENTVQVTVYAICADAS